VKRPVTDLAASVRDRLKVLARRPGTDEVQAGRVRGIAEPDAIVAHDRRSIRLSGYDYGQAGAYFVTMCTQDRVCAFGDIRGGDMRLNAAGEMVQDVWNGLPTHYPGVDIDAFVVMPDHVHGIIILTGDESVGAGPRACPCGVRNGNDGQPQGVAPTENPTRRRLTLPDAVHRFKSFTTARYRAGVRDHGWPAFDRRLWQRNYHERIVRTDAELDRIRQHIVNNPAFVHSDREWPNQA